MYNTSSILNAIGDVYSELDYENLITIFDLRLNLLDIKLDPHINNDALFSIILNTTSLETLDKFYLSNKYANLLLDNVSFLRNLADRIYGISIMLPIGKIKEKKLHKIVDYKTFRIWYRDRFYAVNCNKVYNDTICYSGAMTAGDFNAAEIYKFNIFDQHYGYKLPEIPAHHALLLYADENCSYEIRYSFFEYMLQILDNIEADYALRNIELDESDIETLKSAFFHYNIKNEGLGFVKALSHLFAYPALFQILYYYGNSILPSESSESSESDEEIEIYSDDEDELGEEEIIYKEKKNKVSLYHVIEFLNEKRNLVFRTLKWFKLASYTVSLINSDPELVQQLWKLSITNMDNSIDDLNELYRIGVENHYPISIIIAYYRAMPSGTVSQQYLDWINSL